MKTRAFPKYFVHDCITPGPFKHEIFLTDLVIMRPLIQFESKIRPTKLQKSAKFCLT